VNRRSFFQAATAGAAAGAAVAGVSESASPTPQLSLVEEWFRDLPRETQMLMCAVMVYSRHRNDGLPMADAAKRAGLSLGDALEIEDIFL